MRVLRAIKPMAIDKTLSGDLIQLQVMAVAAAANAIVITDHEGIILSVNPTFTRLTGFSA
jgi:PAS domain-containing protein